MAVGGVAAQVRRLFGQNSWGLWGLTQKSAIFVGKIDKTGLENDEFSWGLMGTANHGPNFGYFREKRKKNRSSPSRNRNTASHWRASLVRLPLPSSVVGPLRRRSVLRGMPTVAIRALGWSDARYVLAPRWRADLGSERTALRFVHRPGRFGNPCAE